MDKKGARAFCMFLLKQTVKMASLSSDFTLNHIGCFLCKPAR
jgi:hypothetical protein